MADYIEREALISIFNAKADMAIGTPKEVFSAAAKMVELLPAAEVVEVKKGEILLPLTAEELRHLINDTISYIWKMEDSNRNKEEFGYFSRKKLLEKLKNTEMSVCSYGERRKK